MRSPVNRVKRLPRAARHLVGVWVATARASLVREAAFRVNFVVGLIHQLLWLGAFLLMIEAIFQSTSALAGWSQREVLVVLALSRLLEGGMNMFFARNIGEFPNTVRTGAFDYVLVKPVPAQLLTAFGRFHFQYVGNVVSGLILLAYAAAGFAGPVTPLLPILVVLVLASLTIFYSLLIMFASLAFAAERLEAIWPFMNILSEPLTVPFDIFPSHLRLVLTYVLPLAFVVFVPAQAVVGRLNYAHVPLAILIAAICLALATIAWRAGVRRYSSASS